MAVGKNKKMMKKKGANKKIVDPFIRKDWYDVKAPSLFSVRTIAKTPVNRTVGLKSSEDSLRCRVFTASLADLNNDEEQAFRKMKLIVEDISGNSVLTNFHGMDFTRDKLCSLIKKWQTLIEANVDIKTTDGYHLRLFCIAFTKRRPNQLKKATYAQSSHIRTIRKKMCEVMVREASSCDLKDLVQKFIPEVIGKEIEKACHGTYPLQNCFIRKAKILKKPKYDVSKLLELHGEGKDKGDKGSPVDREKEHPADL